jgi:hypothetical protein
VTWLLLTGAGLIAETVVIVVLGRTATARYDLENALPQRPDPTARGRGRGIDPGEPVAAQSRRAPPAVDEQLRSAARA